MTISWYVPILSVSVIPRFLSQTQTQIESAEKLVNSYFETHTSVYPKMVRFAFHSCVGPSGCNGCININHPDNKGLENILEDLNELYIQTSGFSRADFWALSAVTVLDFVKPSKTENKKEYIFGRIDCEQSPNETDFWEYPEPRKDWAHVERIFGENSIFGLTVNETVALIGGAHSLGKPHLQVSGFEKPWDPSETTLDNTNLNFMYYNDYEQALSPENKTQWYGVGNGMYHKFGAFNTDVALWKNITLNSTGIEGSVVGCRDSKNTVKLHSCQNNPKTSKYFKSLATGSSSQLFEDFRAAYLKMLKAGLVVATTTVETTVASTTPDSTTAEWLTTESSGFKHIFSIVGLSLISTFH